MLLRLVHHSTTVCLMLLLWWGCAFLKWLQIKRKRRENGVSFDVRWHDLFFHLDGHTKPICFPRESVFPGFTIHISARHSDNKEMVPDARQYQSTFHSRRWSWSGECMPVCICVSGFVTSGLEPEPAFLSIIVYSAVPAESLPLSFYVVFIIRINLFFPLLVWCHCPWSRVHLLCDSVFFLSLFFCALFSPCFSFSIFSPPLSVRAWGEEKTSSRQDRTSQWKVWNRSG